MTKTNNYFDQLLENLIIGCERQELQPYLSQKFGYHLVQLGADTKDQLLTSSLIQHRVCIVPPDEVNSTPLFKIQADYKELPLLDDSIDLIILSHILEENVTNEEILAEVWRVLIPQGQAVILGFNYYSFWRLAPQLKKLHEKCIRFQKPRLVCQSLLKQGFEIIAYKTFCYRPPLINPNSLRRLGFMETLAHFCWPFGGAIYLFVVKKTVTTLTPIRPSWHLKEVVRAKGVVQPSRRNFISE
jgi:SAM-dependent methyltransferase